MTTDRRDFLRLTALAGGALATGLVPGSAALAQAAASSRATRARGAPLNILVLGGTSFIGPHMVRYALERGHRVTLFNRGRTNPGLFPEAQRLIGDRTGDVSALAGKKFDFVIDNSAIQPDWVERTGKVLQGNVGHYLFISTRSVYADVSRVPMTIDAPVHNRQTQPPTEGRPLPYGLAKAESEAMARKYYADRFTIVRPGLIIGPGDDTDRFTYWPVRIERGGEVLSPGDGSDPVQIIDARDLGEWVVRLGENRTLGIFNGVGPKVPRRFDEFLHGIKAVTTSDATFTWVPVEFLAAQRVRPYAEMPVWRPARDGWEGFARFDLTREIASGLTFRPLAVTAKDTLDYYHTRSREEQERLRAGITPEREAEVLRLWREARK